jgi:uncharacterized lipoprotein YajG
MQYARAVFPRRTHKEVGIVFIARFRLIFVVVAIFALAGCAQFQDSFGAVTDLLGSGAVQSAPNSDATPSMQSRAGRKNLAVGDVMVQLSDGRLLD